MSHDTGGSTLPACAAPSSSQDDQLDIFAEQVHVEDGTYLPPIRTLDTESVLKGLTVMSMEIHIHVYRCSPTAGRRLGQFFRLATYTLHYVTIFSNSRVL